MFSIALIDRTCYCWKNLINSMKRYSSNTATDRWTPAQCSWHMKHPEIVNAMCFMHSKKTFLFVLIICFLRNTRIIKKVDPWNYYSSMVNLIPGFSREKTIFDNIRQSLNVVTMQRLKRSKFVKNWWHILWIKEQLVGKGNSH